MSNKEIPAKKSCKSNKTQPAKKSLDKLISEFKRNHEECRSFFISTYSHLPEPELFQLMARCHDQEGRCFDHLRHIPVVAKSQASIAIRKMYKKIKVLKTFEEVHEVIESAVQSVRGIGPVYIYDMSALLAKRLGIEPNKFVYLHAGTLRGARALGIQGHCVPCADFHKHYPSFKMLSADDIENFLCIYHEELKMMK